jgi:elongation factor P
MSSYSTNSFKSGLKIILDGQPSVILDAEFVKPGKGQAFCRVKIKNLLTSKVLEKTFKSNDSVPAADVTEQEYDFSYKSADSWIFMHPETFEQIEVQKEAISQAVPYLQEQDRCTITIWNNNPILVLPPTFVEVQIVETDPGVKGDTATGGSKPATLITGAVVRVPLFIQQDEVIKVDTRTGEYVARAKQ